MRFPWAPVCSPEEILENPQLESRRFFVDVEHPEMARSISYPGIPWQFNRSLINKWKRAPFMGEDNIQIYTRELNLSEGELTRLSSKKVI
jgi:crotonobetainyl-CoA:carnitine CoA-transferase CaiB-like acyl-CoA transferase